MSEERSLKSKTDSVVCCSCPDTPVPFDARVARNNDTYTIGIEYNLGVTAIRNEEKKRT